jgi:hypothetical protein
MGLLNVLVEDSADVLREAERDLMDMENRVFRPVPQEALDLATHVAADIPRFETLSRRQRVMQLRLERAQNRNMVVTIVGLVLVSAARMGALDWLLKLAGAL